MNNLLSANCARLKKNKMFCSCMAVMLCCGVFFVISCYRKMVLYQDSGITYTLSQVYFQFAIFIGLICAVWISFFLGTEYSDGTIRNKIVVGQTRKDIYLANLVVGFVASLLLMLVWFFSVTVIGLPLFGGKISMSALLFITYLVVSIFMVLAFVSLFTLIGMLSHNKAITVVSEILIFLGLLLLASVISNRLNEPELMNGIVITADGYSMGDGFPNPAYVSGTIRKVLEFVRDFLPTGQAFCLSELQNFNYVVGILSSIFITVITTISGVVLFQKKDIK